MTTNAQLWIIDDDDSIRWVLEKAFADSRYHVRSFANGEDFFSALKTDAPTVVLTDIRMPGENGLAVLEKLGREQPQLPVVVMTAHSDLETTVKAFQGGAFEYLAKPFDIDEAITAVDRALQHARQSETTANESIDNNVPELIGEAAPMQDVFRAIGRLSSSSVSVLLTGETGTGKEVVARALHKHSPRAEKPFIALNMAAIPADLIESELFGHERGAFTGADRKRVGRFQQADGGTLFLDEIGDMPLPVQTRLLRVLAEGQFYPVGAHQPVKVDVRVIAATHRELEQLVDKGQFRDDLYHRLNVIRLRLPPLRERTEDIATLAKHFLKKSAEELNVTPKTLLNKTLSKLMSYSWPGNVRQLENTCRWLTVMAPGQNIGVNDLPEDILVPADSEPENFTGELTWLHWLERELEKHPLEAQDVLQSYQHQLEKIALQTALQRFSGHKQKAATWLGWGRNTLTRKLKTLLK
ncbi:MULTISPECIES: nitrogen regulation protein NR(I) [Idiomarina]|jgi:two-component system nitrogen regulation response regulator GlnG|uniref:nitrogen regulation protein NR(I) n=1 Tax=Idiomarina TaxID=135575 RepID=UPI000C3BDF3B|nr:MULTISPECIES: nitrogen regulation protein NR(I) [Idiomarina]MAO67022.1 nitrogen regulation protein NR(I) [Idiomarina sp.]MBF80144.1 nitrogen regulation protein NR(I) [Idiomarina sp.]|tara:strand:- start:8038 stop:9444 length:1407 start_codon:yes stop_codon:yes gene_type:complete